MNEPGNEPQNTPRAVEPEDTVESLRRQVNLLFGGLIITSFTLTLFLGLQARRASMDLMSVQAHAAEQFRQNQQDAAAIQSVFGKLTDFARTHPDFQKQILSRYRFNTNAPAAPAKK
jgi:hypothetical protein